MKITCVSDLHGFYPKLEGGDLLIVAGDLTCCHTPKENIKFLIWIESQDYKKKVFIAGNHDTDFTNKDVFSGKYIYDFEWQNVEYLCDSGTEFEGLKIWGCPWTPWFKGINPKCTAFTGTENYLQDKFALIPHDVDILITHGPAFGALDRTIYGEAGSLALNYWLKYVGRPYLHVFGHIHEDYGIEEYFLSKNDKMMKAINCSHVDEDYRPINPPVNIILEV